MSRGITPRRSRRAPRALEDVLKFSPADSVSPDSNMCSKINDMSESDAERLLAARITGTAARYARGRPLSGAEEAEALTSLTELAAGVPICTPRSRIWRSASLKGLQTSLGNSKPRSYSSKLALTRG